MNLKDYPIPKNRSKRGMHWSASEYPEEGHWQDHLALCRDMGISWIKFVDDGGASGLNVYRSCWHDFGIIPVVRFYIGANGKCGPREADAVKRIADVLGFRTYFEFWNELDLPLEWAGNRPRDWLNQMLQKVIINAGPVFQAGGLLGTPALASGAMSQVRVDEKGNVLDPVKFNWIKTIVDGLGGPAAAQAVGLWLSDHNYTLDHPPDYPYDAVNQTGQALTKAEYDAVPLWAWDGRSMDAINAQRARDKNPGADIGTDDTCFGGYKIFLAYAAEAGIDVPLITTEGGPTLTRGDDGRYPKVTADIMCDWLPRMYREMATVPQYYAHCHWLLYNTTNGWESDRWLDGAEDYSKPKALFLSTPVGAWGEVIAVTPPIIIPGAPGPLPTGGNPVPDPVYPVATPTAWLFPSWEKATLVSASVQPGETYWHITRAYLGADNMANTLWFDVKNRDKTGVIPDGGMIRLSNAGGPIFTLPIKALPDLQDQPEFRHDNYSFWLEDAQGRQSDRVNGILAEIVGLPAGVNTGHIPRVYEIELCQAPGTATPDPTPTPIPTTPGLMVIIEQTWTADGRRRIVLEEQAKA